MTSAAPFVSLIRRYVLDYLACGDTSVCDEIMHPDFLLYMGGHELGPRDDVYVPAVAKQMEQFPGLCMTANEVMSWFKAEFDFDNLLGKNPRRSNGNQR